MCIKSFENKFIKGKVYKFESSVPPIFFHVKEIQNEDHNMILDRQQFFQHFIFGQELRKIKLNKLNAK